MSVKGFIILPQNLTKYIKKSNKKVGAIRAQKITLTPENIDVVFITHSKAHLQYDTFNKSMMKHILENRYKYMYDIICDRINPRVKNSKSYTYQLRKLYDYMYKRSKTYFKDCSSVYQYINMFEYINDAVDYTYDAVDYTYD